MLFIMSWSLFCQIKLLHSGYTDLNLQPLKEMGPVIMFSLKHTDSTLYCWGRLRMYTCYS